MKNLKPILILFSVLLFLFSCKSKSQENTPYKKIMANHMDFTDWKRENFRKISYLLPTYFKASNTTNFVVDQSKSLTKQLFYPDIFFSIEQFSPQEVNSISEKVKISDQTEALQKYYINKRKESLTDFSVSIARKMHLKNGIHIIRQTVIGNIDEYDADNTAYLTASFEAKNKFYTIQLIGSYAEMQYFFDDFIFILQSVQA